MTFTYDPDNLAEPINQLRCLIQDTDPTNVLLQDSEILFFAQNQTNMYLVAAKLCRMIAAKFAQKPNIGDKDVAFKNDSTAREYRLLASDLEKQAQSEDPANSGEGSGGISFPSIPGGSSTFTRDLHLG